LKGINARGHHSGSQRFSGARQHQLTIDFGETIEIRKTSAQITKRYSKADLLERQIVAVVNFPKKQIGKFMSECLVLGAVGARGCCSTSPDFKIENGLRSVNKDTSFLDTIFKYFTNLVLPSSINIDRFYN
jgi:tRNA-binding protein